MAIELKKNIEKGEIEHLKPFLYTGEILVIEDAVQAEKTAHFLNQFNYLGFDTETRPAFHKGESYKVGLLQLSTDNEVYLFRLNKCGFVEGLRKLLSAETIKKIGVGIRDDLRNLRKSGEFSPAGFIDLQEFVMQYGIEDKSFSKLMAIIFGVKISKRQRTSNWEAPVLTEAQLRYAATDAYGALKMYQRLSEGTDQFSG